jgi:hypothetical protein
MIHMGLSLALVELTNAVSRSPSLESLVKLSFDGPFNVILQGVTFANTVDAAGIITLPPRSGGQH